MEPSLQMVPQVVSLIAKELALIYNDANLVWDPPRGAPQLTLVGVSDGCVEHEDGRCLSDGLAGRQRLITLAPIAPALRRRLPLGAGLENLGEGRLGILLVSGENLRLDPLASAPRVLGGSRMITIGGYIKSLANVEPGLVYSFAHLVQRM